MQKTILLTGATDGIGFETAKMLVSMGHNVLLHGRNQSKLTRVEKELSGLADGGLLKSYVADLSRKDEVQDLARAVSSGSKNLDILINNAGVFVTSNQITDDGLDVRFAVNSIAPYLLTRKLLPLMNSSGRVINLSSAAQSSVDLKALSGQHSLDSDHQAYAQSKLAITMWSYALAHSLRAGGPSILAVNPGSLLGSKMVKEAFGMDGGDLKIGAEILCRAALSDEFSSATGQYFDNDSGQFSNPHPDARNPQKCKEIVESIEAILAKT